MIGVTDRDVRNVKRLRDYRLELIIRVIGGIRQRRQGMGSGKLIKAVNPNDEAEVVVIPASVGSFGFTLVR